MLVPFSSPFSISRYDVAWRGSQLFLLISRPRAFDVRFWFCTFHWTISCLHVDFEGFKLALRSTVRQNKSFWLSRPGDKHDEKISNCSSTPKLVQAHSTILPWLLRLFNFSYPKTPNLMVFSEIYIKRKCLLLPNRNWFSSWKPRELQCTTVSKRRRLWDGFARHLSAIMFFKCH